jgi:hypothetical protein
MFAEIKKNEKLQFLMDGKLIIYDFIQTSHGQSGCPILLKYKDQY